LFVGKETTRASPQTHKSQGNPPVKRERERESRNLKVEGGMLELDRVKEGRSFESLCLNFSIYRIGYVGRR
jgi:hypothetical protein